LETPGLTEDGSGVDGGGGADAAAGGSAELQEAVDAAHGELQAGLHGAAQTQERQRQHVSRSPRTHPTIFKNLEAGNEARLSKWSNGSPNAPGLRRADTTTVFTPSANTSVEANPGV
jgi:hypothetical protein